MPISSITIKYDGQSPWGEAVPYIQIDRQPIFFGGKWGQVMNVTLNGQLSLGMNAGCFQCQPHGQFVLAPDAATAVIFCRNLNAGNTGAAPVADQSKCLNLGGWGNVSNYPSGVTTLENARDAIISVFKKNLKTFEFEDSEAPPNKMSFPNTVVESIEFPESGYHSFLDYVIRLKCYEQDFFLAQGVVDPRDEWQLTEGEDGSLSITHNISARGVDFTSGAGVENGLDNAVEWVKGRVGVGLISNDGLLTAWDCGQAPIGVSNIMLLTQNETINRMEGEYSLVETFIGYFDEDNNVPNLKAVSKYSIQMSQSLNQDFRDVTISGEIKGGKDTSMSDLRSAVIKNDDVVNPTGKKGLYEKAKEVSGMDGSDLEHPILHRIPMSYTLDESIENKTISIKAKFDTNPLFVDDDNNESRHFFDYTVDVSTDEITQISKIVIKGNLKVRGLMPERKCYIQKFLDNTDLMEFLSKKAKAEYEVIMKVCHKCSGKDPNSDPPDETVQFFAKAQPGESAAEACAGWSLYTGGTSLGDDPIVCWTLNPCAESMSVTRNEAGGQLEMSATFNDKDHLYVHDDEGFGCYDKASYSVSVNNPVDFVKINASGQKENSENSYNGHWAIQKFGIKTRAKSTTKVDLTMRQDTTIPSATMEDILRTRADELLVDLNTALRQEGVAIDYEGNPQVAALGMPDGPYDINKTISHKESAAESISVSLERSYIPEDEGSFCSELPEPTDQKACFDCVTSGGVTHGEVYAYQSGEGIPSEAQELCDDIAEKEGLSQQASATTSAPGGTTTTGGTAAHVLTPTPCKNCYVCYKGSDVVQDDMQELDIAAAQAACEGLGGDLAYPCGTVIEEKCYNCIADGSGEVLDPPGDFNALTEYDALQICDQLGEESAPQQCATAIPDCWSCMNMSAEYLPNGVGYTFVYAASQEEATNACQEEASHAGIPIYNVAVVSCGDSAELKCWKCSDGSVITAYTESAGQAACPDNELDSAVTQPVPCS